MKKVVIKNFLVCEVTNPETNETMEKLYVELADGSEFKLFHPNHTIEQLKKDAVALKQNAMIGETEFGKYVYFPAKKETERF